jgi:hypothetical protein
MSKNKRKRRLKEEDFKKKKLKVGKKLPMPDNVTKTNFKARRVNVSQQVQSGSVALFSYFLRLSENIFGVGLARQLHLLVSTIAMCIK